MVARSSWIGDYDYVTTFAGLFQCHVAINHSYYCNDHYDALLKKAASATDPEEQARYYAEAERLAMADYPVIPLYQYVAKHLVKPYIGGYQSNLLDHYHSADWYVIEH